MLIVDKYHRKSSRRVFRIILLFHRLSSSTGKRKKKGASDNSLMQWITRVLCRAWCLEDMSALPVAQFPIDGSKYRAKNSTVSPSPCFLPPIATWKNPQVAEANCNEFSESKAIFVDVKERKTLNVMLRITVMSAFCCRWTIESDHREHHDAWPLPCRFPSRPLALKNLLRCK